MGLVAGTRLGPYEIQSAIGAGGMGEVYKARDTRLDRTVAIKVLPPEVSGDPERRARFEREAKTVAGLNHAHICVLHDVGDHEGSMFLVMEHVEGKTLDSLIPPGGMRIGEVLRVGSQVASALSAAHAHGIVHRDVKPGNIMVTAEGVAKVLDFGLAKLGDAATTGPDAGTSATRAQTEAGLIIGTVSYMSPEQARGKPVDIRSDIFSLGAVLYEMVTGRKAFDGENRLCSLSAVLTQEPVPLEGVHHDLEKTILRCLRKDPEKRFQHMDDVRVALEELKDELDSEKRLRALDSRSRRRWAGPTAAVAAVVLLASAVTWWLRGSAARSELTASALTTYSGIETQPSFSPDGTKLAFVWNGEKEDNDDIWVRQIGAEGRPMHLTTSPSKEGMPAWSPDDRWIAFARQQQEPRRFAIVLIPPLGGPERQIAEVEGTATFLWRGPAGLCWSPDGKWLLVSERDASGSMVISAISEATGKRRRLTTVGAPGGAEDGDTYPAISPDGRSLAFSRGKDYVRDVYVMPLTADLRPDGDPAKVTDAHYPWLNGIAWAANGREVVYGAGGIYCQALWRVAVSGREKPRALPFATREAFLPAIAHRTSRLAYAWRLYNTNLWRLDTNTRETIAVIRSTYDSRLPQYSPDGRKIAFQSNRSGNQEVWTCDADGSNCQRLTSFDGPQCGTPRWSPDGRSIAFDSRPLGRAELFVIAADGGTPHRLTNGAGHDSTQPSWSTDGRWIYLTSNRSGRSEVWQMPAGGGDATQLTRSGAEAALSSPDGKYIYYVRQQPGPRLCRIRAEGGEEQEVVADDLVNWGSYGLTAKGVYFVTKQLSLQFLDAATGKVTTLARVPSPTWGLSVSPDGRYVVWGQNDRNTTDLMLVEGYR